MRTHWHRLGVHIETESEALADSPASWTRLPRVSVRRENLTRRASIVIVRTTRTHRHRTAVSFDPFLLRLLLLFIAAGAASALTLGIARLGSRAAAMGTMGEGLESHSHVASHLRSAPVWAESAAKLVSTDVRNLAAQLRETVAVSAWSAEEDGVSVFDALAAAALHLDEWCVSRAPIVHWGSSLCLSGLGVAPAGAPPPLKECLAPLTRDVTKLLGRCLVKSPWRVCRLALRYVAFVWTRALSSAVRQPEEWARRRGHLLASLLEEVNGLLSGGEQAEEDPLAALGAEMGSCVRRAASALNGAAVAAYELSTCLSNGGIL